MLVGCKEIARLYRGIRDLSGDSVVRVVVAVGGRWWEVADDGVALGG